MEGWNWQMYQWIFLYSIQNFDYIDASDQIDVLSNRWKYVNNRVDKASDFESEDCGFKSHRGCLPTNYTLLTYK